MWIEIACYCCRDCKKADSSFDLFHKFMSLFFFIENIFKGVFRIEVRRARFAFFIELSWKLVMRWFGNDGTAASGYFSLRIHPKTISKSHTWLFCSIRVLKRELEKWIRSIKSKSWLTALFLISFLSFEIFHWHV